MPPPNLQSSPQEDLSVVMGRFHAWDADRKKSSVGTQAGAVRELSYEEALSYSHPRRPAKGPQTSAPAAASSTFNAVSPGRKTADAPAEPADMMKAQPTRKPLVADSGLRQPEAQAEVSPARKPARSAPAARKADGSPKATKKKASAGATSAMAREPVAVATVAAKTSVQQKARPSKGTTNLPSSAASPRASAKPSPKSVRKPVSSAPNEPRRSATFHGALAACLKEAPRRVTSRKTALESKSVNIATQPSLTAHRSNEKSSKAKHRKKGPMRAGSAEKSVPRKPVESVGRTISVNLRLSKPEHDRMRRGAAEADLSLATFIRESTLRFQIGREREKQRMLESGNTATAHDVLQDLDDDSFDRPILEPGGPSLLTRMKNFWLGRRLAAIA